MIAPKRRDSRTLVKICGLATAEAALAAAKGGADLIGFVFAESRRRVSAERAAAIAGALGGFPDVVKTGVFVNPDLAELEHAAKTAGLDAVQLHGEESPAFCREVKNRLPGIKIIKAFGVSAKPAARAGKAGKPAAGAEPAAGMEAEPAATGMEAEPAADAALAESMEKNAAGYRPGAERFLPYAGIADAFLVDSAGGGTGRRFSWDIIPDCKAAAARLGVPLIVAGGLAPDNVGDLVKRHRPNGVDVSSGVETDGRKDIAKIAAFIERVRTIDQERA